MTAPVVAGAVIAAVVAGAAFHVAVAAAGGWDDR